ncbi:MAG: glycosyltransferase family 4 protein [bacterium]
MKILMLGWEFPPLYAGGVGVVCDELSKALVKKGEEITFVMPSGPSELRPEHLKMIIADKLGIDGKIKFKKISTLLTPYVTVGEYEKQYTEAEKVIGKNTGELYGRNLMGEVYNFAARIVEVGKKEKFDVIHAHDWTTFPASRELKNIFKKPLVAHMHITEFDKSGGLHANPDIYRIEREGMEAADAVIAVSNRVKQMCVDKYYISADKISVVYNAAVSPRMSKFVVKKASSRKRKIVLFAGRMTLQKGPDYFVEAAKIVLTKNPEVLFVMAGTGDMLPKIIEKTAACGIGDKFVFTGFYTRKEAEKLFGMADVFVMPSVSEPFGITPLEAQRKGVPTIISKQTGVSEVLNHCLKVNFWDVKALAGMILEVLEYRPLKEELSNNGYKEAKGLTWEKPASECINIYNRLAGLEVGVC